MALLRAVSLSVLMVPLLCLGTHTARAQAVDAGMQAREAQVRELFSLMHMQATYSQVTEQTMRQANRQFEQFIPQNSMNDAQKKEYDLFIARVQSLVTSALSWQVLEPDFERVYAENLTESDLSAVIAFYRSPAGQNFVAKEPQLAEAASALTLKRMQVLMPQLQSMQQDEMKKMATQTSPPPAAAPGTKN
jgi:hypothetical protein